MSKMTKRLVAIVPAAALATPSFAAGGLDYSALTGAVDGVTIASAILVVGGIMVLPRLAKAGARWIKGSVN